MRRKRNPIIVALFFILCFACALFFPTLAAGLQQPTPILRIGLLVLRFAAATFLLAGLVALGSLLLRALRLRTETIEEHLVFSLAIGICAVTYLLFFISALKLLYPAATTILLIVLALTIIWELCRFEESKRPSSGSPLAQANSPALWLLIGLLALLFIPPLISSLTPPYSWDAQVYHLLLPKKFLQHHGFTYVPLNIYSNMPFNLDLLYLLAMAAADDVVAKLMHFALAVALCVALYAFARRRSRPPRERLGAPTLGILAAILFFVHPMVNYEAGVAFIDVGLAFFTLLLFYSFWLAFAQGNANWGVVMGILSGFLIGAKYTGAFASAAILVTLFVVRIFPPRGETAIASPHSLFQKNFRKILFSYLILSFLLFLPWAAKSLIYTGNPVYPMLYGWFDGRDWTPRMARWLTDWQHNIGQGRGLTDYLLLPYRVFFRSGGGYENFAGALSPLSLVLLPLAIPFLRRWNACALALIGFAAYFILWSFSAQQVRFLIPALPLLALVAASGLDELRKRRAMIFYAFFAVIALHAAVFSLQPRLRETLPDTPVIFATQTRDDFLEARVRSFACFRQLHRIADPKTDRILFLFENMGYYCDFDFLADGMFEASYFVDLALQCGDATAFARNVHDMGFRYVLVNHNILRDVSEIRRKPLFRNPQLHAEYLRGLSIIEQFIAEHLVHLYEKHNSAIYEIR